MSHKLISRSLLILCLALILFPDMNVSAETVTAEANLAFVGHLMMGLPEQDVMIADEEGALWRVAPENVLPQLNQRLYASTTGAEPDPFRLGVSSLGAFEQGKPLGLTLGDWMAAVGSGRYVEVGDYGLLNATFARLVSHGVYSVWCARVLLPPVFEITYSPCGVSDGAQNTFIANADGSAGITLSIRPVPVTTDRFQSAFFIIYHSDGQTHGASPGIFGVNAHTQLIAVLPGAATRQVPTDDGRLAT